MVSPVPSSKVFKMFTANNWYYGFFKGKLAFEKVEDPDAMHKFDLSLGNKELMYKPIHLEKYLVLKNKKGAAVMGCGHFVATLKREVFDKGSNAPAFIKIVGGVERKFIDTPNEELGLLRLATKGNYAYHMGNSTEPWMFDEFNSLVKNDIPPTFNGQEFIYQPISFLGSKFGFFVKAILDRSKKITMRLLNFYGLKSNEY